MRIYIARHAWADEPDEDTYPDDRQRPLTEPGRRRYRRMLETMIQRGFAPDLIASSPLVRCLQTAEIMADVVPTQPDIVVLPALSPGADATPLLQWSCQQNVNRIAWVGHAPDVGWLTAALIGGPNSAIAFAKGGIAEVRFEETPELGAGYLHWFVTAKLLGC